ncbi:MAG: 50S ribosomal protein L11 methyltransferase [Bacteroidetes bacterium]|nr:MAG: 50S ribosomal protein L11 methyltransferase [Bacteroidota bacterium]
MKAEYVQVQIELPEHQKEVAIALLASIGFEAFEETEQGLIACIGRESFEEERLNNMLEVVNCTSFRTQLLPPQNWNATWEAQYPSVFVDDFCQVIPTFRQPRPGFEHCLIIDPKMSFGTGHHETTRLMIRMMRQLDFSRCRVLDMGCGTGILAILAAKLGAEAVTGIDIDPWSYENARENVQLNGSGPIDIRQGDARSIPPGEYDLILANINRNVLLADMPVYAQHLKAGGKLLISGFYQTDVPSLLQSAQALGLRHAHALKEADWAALLFEKTRN